MSNPITLQSFNYTGFTEDSRTFSTSFAFGIPDWDALGINVYEASQPSTPLTYNRLSDTDFQVFRESGTPINGTIVVALDVPADELVRNITNGNVFKEDTLRNLLVQALMVAGAVSEGRLNLVGNFDFGGFRGINAADPVNDQDLVTKGYVQVNLDAAVDAAEAAQLAAENAQVAAEDAEDGSEAAALAAGNAQTAAESARDAAIAAVGAVKVSTNDTTAGDLETKLVAGNGIALATQNDGANETRSVAVAPNTPFAMAGFRADGSFNSIFLAGGLVRDDQNLAVDFADEATAIAGVSTSKVLNPLGAKQARRFRHVQTVNLSSGAPTVIEFTNLNANHYVMVGEGVTMNTDAVFVTGRLSTNNGVSFDSGNNYAVAGTLCNSAGNVAGRGSTGRSSFSVADYISPVGSAAGEDLTFLLELANLSSANSTTPIVHQRAAFETDTGVTAVSNQTARYLNSGGLQVNAIQISAGGTATFQTGLIHLYEVTE